jgi:AAA+ superfamily ATPase
MLQDDYPKVILTLDDDPPMDIDGIKILNARDWLLDLKQ